MNSSSISFVFVVLVLSSKNFIYNFTEPVNGQNLKKEELEYRENVCAGRPICNLTVLPEVGLYKCMCDADCSIYGDCCSDSAYYNQTFRDSNSRTKLPFFCPEQFKFYVINKCPPHFANASLQILCENVTIEGGYKNVKTVKPVMDPTTRITYSNAYCASCNDVVNFESFALFFMCSGAHKFENIPDFDYLANILVEAKFNAEAERLTSIYNGTEYVCSHEVVIPTHLESHLRYCVPKLISSCPSTYNDSSVIEKCRSINYAMYSSNFGPGDGDVYKNKFCAVCNGVQNLDNLYHCQEDDSIGFRMGASSLWSTAHQSSVICGDPRLSRFC